MDVKSLRRSERTTGIENDNKFKDDQSTVKVEDQPTGSTSERQVRHHRRGFSFPPMQSKAGGECNQPTGSEFNFLNPKSAEKSLEKVGKTTKKYFKGVLVHKNIQMRFSETYAAGLYPENSSLNTSVSDLIIDVEKSPSNCVKVTLPKNHVMKRKSTHRMSK